MQSPCYSCIYNCGHCRLGFLSAAECNSHLSWQNGIRLFQFNTNGEEFINDSGSSILKSYDQFCYDVSSYLNFKYFKEMPEVEKEKLRINFPKTWELYDRIENQSNKNVRKQIFKEYQAYWEDDGV